jgi:hypothetical protein
MSMVIQDEDAAIPAWKFLTDPELFSWKQLVRKGRLNHTEAEEPEYVRLKEKCTSGTSAATANERVMDIFCDVHRLQMLKAGPKSAIALQAEMWPFPSFGCKSLGCKRHFVESLGYFDMVSNNLDSSTLRVMHCPTHAGAVAIIAIHGSTLFWKCIHEGCEAFIPRFTDT